MRDEVRVGNGRGSGVVAAHRTCPGQDHGPDSSGHF